MNSLTELNNYNGSLSFLYDDQRLADVKFDRTSPDNQTQTVNEGETFSASVGIEIIDVANYTLSQPYYTIDVSALVGCTVSWPTVPSGCTVTNPSTGIYTISGVNSASIWDSVKSPNIILPSGLPNSFYGTFNYTSTIDYYSEGFGFLSKEWTTAVTVLDITLMTNPTEFTYTTSSTSLITGTPQIIDLDALYPGATWTISTSVSSTLAITSFSSASASGGTFTFNNTTKTFIISGTRTQVNAHLAAISLTSTSSNIDFNISYLLSNNQTSETDTKVQTFKNADIEFLSNVTSSVIYYAEDANSYLITGQPLITDTSFDGTGTYTLTVTPSSTSAISSMSSVGASGTSSFNSSTKVLTISGTRGQVNDHLNEISIVTAVDYSTTFTLTYYVTTPRSSHASKMQTLICNTNDIEITNMDVTRNYTGNNGNLIFSSNTPSISDFDDNTGAVYSIVLDCTFGDWSYRTTPGDANTEITATNPLTITGIRSYINDRFSTIKFYPVSGTSSNGTFNYKQYKDSVLQVDNTVVLNGTAGTYTGGRTITFTTTQTWTPSNSDVRYGKISGILLAGGGGAGGAGSIGSGQYFGGGGGGGGGVKYSSSSIYFTSGTTYTISIGSGGSYPGGNGNTTTAFSLSIAGGLGGKAGGSTGTNGYGGTSGPGVGSNYSDDSGLNGGTRAVVANPTGGYNGGGGGGHLSVNGGLAANGSNSSGGRGGYGFDEPNGANSYWGAGGGGGGTAAGSAGNAATSGKGASSSTSATTIDGYGGGGGGGYGSNAGAKGGDGVVKIIISSK